MRSVARWDDSERSALIALLRHRPGGRSWSDLTSRVADAASALAVWREFGEHTETLFEDGALSARLSEAAAELNGWRADRLHVLTFPDEEYPAQLREIQEMPPLLFARGTLAADARAVSIVGSRSASETALRFTRRLATELSSEGVTIVSGLARGIDTAAHEATLAAGGRTVALIGSGITRYYPPENKSLQERIAVEGLVLSQFWPQSPPQRHTFLMRNAVMSGYGRATVVATAGETSGSRAQARLAVAHGRPVILTTDVVGRTSWGAALEGRPGVHVVSSVDEAVELAMEVTEPLGERLSALLDAG